MTQYASEQHKHLEDLLISGRILGTLTPEQDDIYSEEMAEFWYDMDEEERNAARMRVANYAQTMAANQLENDKSWVAATVFCVSTSQGVIRARVNSIRSSTSFQRDVPSPRRGSFEALRNTFFPVLKSASTTEPQVALN